MAVDKITTGIAGEHFVAAELNSRGITASLTSKNSAIVDILACSRDGSVVRTIQVKTTSNTKRATWRLNKGSEEYTSKNLFYIFVRLNGLDARPDYYVVPSLDVAKYIARCHKKWLSTPKKNGDPKKDSNMRAFDADGDKYLENWTSLGLD